MSYNNNAYTLPIMRAINAARTKLSDDNRANWWFKNSSQTTMLLVTSALAHFNNIGLRVSYNHLTNNAEQYSVNANAHRDESSLLSRLNPESIKDGVFIKAWQVKRNIRDTFEFYLPEYYTREYGWTELNAISLVLKTSPRHRIRVYCKEYTDERGCNVKLIHVYTVNDLFSNDDDALLYRKLLAVTPLLINQTLPETNPELTNIMRSAVVIDDANTFYNNVLTYLNTMESFKNLRLVELRNTFNNLNQTRVHNLQRTELRIKNDIARYEESLKAWYKELYDVQTKIYCGNNDDLTQEDIEFLINKDVVKQLTISGEKIYFNIAAPCLVFDKQAAEKYYNKVLIDDPNTNFARIFKAAFIDESIIILFEDAITVDFKEGYIDARTINHTHNGNVLFNPHHYYYNCWGNYTTIINKLINNYSYMQLFMQIKAAVGSLNMVDYTVLNKFKYQVEQFIHDEQSGYSLSPCVLWKSDLKTPHSLNETLNYLGGNTNETN